MFSFYLSLDKAVTFGSAWTIMKGMNVEFLVTLLTVVAGFIGIAGISLSSSRGLRIDMLERFDKVDARFEKLETSIDERFKKVDARFDKLETSIDERFDKVDERFDKVYERFDKVDERFEKVDARFEKNDDRFIRLLANIDERFDRADANVREQFVLFRAEMSARFAEQDKHFTEQLTGQINVLDRRIVELRTQVRDLDTRLTGQLTALIPRPAREKIPQDVGVLDIS